MLIDGFALWRSQLSESVEDLHLLILGDGPLRSDLEAQVEALGLKNYVLLPGASDYSELPSRYGLAEAFIHASSVEQWGLVVNEAMAAGLPVLVSSACGCVPQLVHPGINGFRFDPGTSSSIAAVITQFMNLQPIQRRRMGQASRRLVSGFGPEAFAAGLTAAVQHASQQNVAQMSRIDQVLIKRLMTRSAASV
jgi:glycosyltransferase involved in cell wall biosynthesis